MPLTADQLTDMRGDLRIGADPAVFTDAQLQRFYTRAGDDYDKAVVYALRNLLMDSAKLYKYTIGATSVSRSEVYTHLQDMLSIWERQAGMTGGKIKIGTLSLGLEEPEESENA